MNSQQQKKRQRADGNPQATNDSMMKSSMRKSKAKNKKQQLEDQKQELESKAKEIEEEKQNKRLEEVDMILLHSICCFLRGIPQNPRYLRMGLIFFWFSIFQTISTCFYSQSDFSPEMQDYYEKATVYFLISLILHYIFSYAFAVLFKLVFRKLTTDTENAETNMGKKYSLIMVFFFICQIVQIVVYSTTQEDKPQLFYSFVAFIILDLVLLDSFWLFLAAKLSRCRCMKNMIFLK